jgi:hypothetical protein
MAVGAKTASEFFKARTSSSMRQIGRRKKNSQALTRRSMPMDLMMAVLPSAAPNVRAAHENFAQGFITLFQSKFKA